jgi:cytochrome d ubiquinol oxidase subunit I
VVYGHLRTADAVSPIAGGAALGTIITAFILYNLLLVSFFWYAGRLVWRGPLTGAPIPPAVPTAALAGTIGLLPKN